MRTLPFAAAAVGSSDSSSSRSSSDDNGDDGVVVVVGGGGGVRPAAALNATDMNGVYMDCKLASDDEANRRVWKMTLRTDSSRGELVYQAEYDLQSAMDEAKGRMAAKNKDSKEDCARNDDDDDGGGWARVMVPFDNFQQVRGPRLVPDGPKLDVSGGIYQIGMTMSKFKMATNTTVIENFRPGYFDLRIQRIGFYKHVDQCDDDTILETSSSNAAAVVPVKETNPMGKEALITDISNANVPETLSKEEAARKRPLMLKLLLPMAKVFFSEQANRRKSAMRLLREERKMSRIRAILFGMQCRKKSVGGLIPSFLKTMRILSVDIFRAVLKSLLKVVLVYPLRLVGATVKMTKRMLGMKVKPSLRE